MRTLDRCVILCLFCHTAGKFCLCYNSYGRWLSRSIPSHARWTSRWGTARASRTATATAEIGSTASPALETGPRTLPTEPTSGVARAASFVGGSSRPGPTAHLAIYNSSVTSPRAWLEAQPSGAYTVLRCDLVVDRSQQNPGNFPMKPVGGEVPATTIDQAQQWKVWGLEFHLDRLRESYGLFVQLEEPQKVVDGALCDDRAESETELQRARNVTVAMIREQLSTNGPSVIQGSVDDTPASVAQVTTFMLTVLWTPRRKADPATPAVARSNHSISVTTHMTVVSSSPTRGSRPLGVLPAPVHAVLAIPNARARKAECWGPADASSYGEGGETHNGMPEAVSTSLPNRLPFPQAKLSSWCRDRRPLEALFQRCDGSGSNVSAGEIILCNVDSSGNTTELLEGLTTNLFVLYRDGTLRTAPRRQVLGGYVRSWIVQHLAHPSRLFPKVRKVVERAPLLEESHRWDEVFVTSSVRLVVPVQSVRVLGSDTDEAVPVWESNRGSETSRDEGNDAPDDGSLADDMYHALLQSIFEQDDPPWPGP